ncbi:unnamed protein product, partial [Mesorhabditis belari]|uniref:Uncharacterized protein n=1 Tax=Mesorhabditis belari TaxID=2138241 RepID=A0AAF3EIP9_9BILA
MAFFSVSSTICLVLLAVVTAMPDRDSVDRVSRDTVTTVVKTVTASIRKCTAEELTAGCTEAPNDFGPDKKSCTCSVGRVRRAPDAEEEAKTTVEERGCTHEEMFDKHCTLVADIGQPLRCKCPV